MPGLEGGRDQYRVVRASRDLILWDTTTGKVVREIKSQAKTPDGEALLTDLPLFAAARPKSHIPAPGGPSPVEDALAAVNPDELTPKAALEALYRLKRLVQKDKE